MQNQEKEERERWLWLLLVGIGMFFTDRLLAWAVYSIRLLYLVPLLVSGVYFLYLCIQISRHKFDRRKCNQLEVWMMEAIRILVIMCLVSGDIVFRYDKVSQCGYGKCIS